MASTNGPIIYTPFTRFGYGWFSRQYSDCAEFELAHVRCLNKVGIVKGEEVCWREKADLIECTTAWKQYLRTMAMAKERRKQGKEFEPMPPKYTMPTFNK